MEHIYRLNYVVLKTVLWRMRKDNDDLYIFFQKWNFSQSTYTQILTHPHMYTQMHTHTHTWHFDTHNTHTHNQDQIHNWTKINLERTKWNFVIMSFLLDFEFMPQDIHFIWSSCFFPPMWLLFALFWIQNGKK